MLRNLFSVEIFVICNWWPFQNKLRLKFAFFVCTIYIVKQTVVSILLKKNTKYRNMCFFPSAAHIYFFFFFFLICSCWNWETLHTINVKSEKSVLYYGLEMKQKKKEPRLSQPSFWFLSLSVCLSVATHSLKFVIFQF